MRMSQTLNIHPSGDAHTIRCSKCDHTFGPAGESWKKQAILQEQVMNELGGPFSTGKEVIMRTFVCPSCGILLDTEVAMKDDPFLEDRLFIRDDPE